MATKKPKVTIILTRKPKQPAVRIKDLPYLVKAPAKTKKKKA